MMVNRALRSAFNRGDSRTVYMPLRIRIYTLYCTVVLRTLRLYTHVSTYGTCRRHVPVLFKYQDMLRYCSCYHLTSRNARNFAVTRIHTAIQLNISVLVCRLS